MNKKTIIGIIIAILVIVVAIVGYVMLNNHETSTNRQGASENRTQIVQNNTNTQSDITDNETSTENTQNTDNNENSTSENGNILIAYYSYTGNTESFANVISEETGGTLFEIQRAEDYNDLYTEAEEEINNNQRPELAAMPENVEQYDTIFRRRFTK